MREWPLGPGVVAGAGALHLDDIGAEVGQELGAVGAGYAVGKVDDAQVGEGLCFQVLCHGNPPVRREFKELIADRIAHWVRRCLCRMHRLFLLT